jgi:hypothetical protein
MLISQGHSELTTGQGRPETDLAELRRLLAVPSAMTERHRQRLVDLAGRLARVRALGDEYLRVDFSPHAAEVLLNEPAESAVA